MKDEGGCVKEACVQVGCTLRAVYDVYTINIGMNVPGPIMLMPTAGVSHWLRDPNAVLGPRMDHSVHMPLALMHLLERRLSSRIADVTVDVGLLMSAGLRRLNERLSRLERRSTPIAKTHATRSSDLCCHASQLSV